MTNRRQVKNIDYHVDILSSEEINKIIKKQQNMKKSSQSEVNMNEYKIIKNTIEMDETECLTDKSYSETPNHNDIHEMHKEVINLHVEEDKEDDTGINMENIEDLKASILNHD